MARLVSLNTGKPGPLIHGNTVVQSGIYKNPVDGALFVTEFGVSGDAQADLVNHAGPDKAACVYPSEHLPYWAERLSKPFTYGAFGENFSTQGLLESGVCIGDVYSIGTAIMQISQPRQPCFKLAAKHGEKRMALWVQDAGFTGFYFRCLEPGEVAAGNAIDLLDRPNPGITIDEANRLMHRDHDDHAALRRILAAAGLSAFWRDVFTQMLATRLPDTSGRLIGPG
jgi:MOSC domain-containing protein YiiM